MFAVPTPSIDRTFCLSNRVAPISCAMLSPGKASGFFSGGNDRYLGRLGLADFPLFRVFLQFELVFSELLSFSWFT